MRYLALTALLLASTAAIAGEKPIQAPVPDWVKPGKDPALLAADPAAPPRLLYDNQQRLTEGEVWNYVDSAFRVASTQMLGQLGTIQLQWQPAHGDLIVHKVEIIRGKERIDVLAGGKTFTVLRREQELERRSMDGLLTATLAVEDLRVGDVLHVTTSGTNRDLTLKGRVQTLGPLLFLPNRVGYARSRLIWPKSLPVRWKAFSPDVKVQPTAFGQMQELEIALPLPKPQDVAPNAPTRFQPFPAVEASSFYGWAQVASIMEPLYRTDGLIAPGSPLAAEVDAIAKAEATPLKRAALALQLVQDKVRYQLMGMETGNYVPQSPAQTWSLRYGDCKAKTLLLLAILHKLGIEAEPVLANLGRGDMVPIRTPSALAFNHVLVRATVDGETLWLDGTGAGTRLADIRDTPMLGSVLPLRPQGAGLMAVAMHANARPNTTSTIAIDYTAGLTLPAPFDATLTVRGPTAEMLRAATAQGSKDDIDKLVDRLLDQALPGSDVAAHSFSFDEAGSIATLQANGVLRPMWTREGARWKYVLDRSDPARLRLADRSRVAWREIPIATGAPAGSDGTMTLRLPESGRGFTLEGSPLSQKIAGATVTRKATMAGGVVTLTTGYRSDGTEIAAADVPAVRRQLTLATQDMPRIYAAAGYPAPWKQIVAAKKARATDKALAAYTARIADKPDEADRYLDRARFYNAVYERKLALADLDKAIALDGTADSYRFRGQVHRMTGDKAAALADITAAQQLDPASTALLIAVAQLKAEMGSPDDGLAMIDERMDSAGEDKADLLLARAEIQGETGDKDGALETVDKAIAQFPGQTALYNSRCWIKGTLEVSLDTAIADCNRAIEMSNAQSAALDSRALIHYRQGDMAAALADYDAALERDPNKAPSIFMRGIVLRRMGKRSEGDAELAGARLIDPNVDEDYKRYGIVP